MDFADLYRIAEEQITGRAQSGDSTVIVSVEELKDRLIAGVDWIDCINIYPIECKAGDPLGHYECHGNKESRYDDADSWVVLITYDDSLNMCRRRFVWCKELMHIFDTVEGLVNSGDVYKGFIDEIELKPLDPSEKYISENRAKWMALLILCPKPQRDAMRSRAESDDLSNYDVALRFRIPEEIVPSLFSDYYDQAHSTLT